MMKTSFSIFLSIILFTRIVVAQTPNGFFDQVHSNYWNAPVGLTFDPNGKMYVWEKAGKVYVFEDNVKTLLIDISQEVLNYNDHGLNGFALDPNYLINGHIYLLYVAKRCHVLGENCNGDDFLTTIGRVTRYTVNFDINQFPSIDYSSRNVLLGESISTGIPILADNHGVGSLVFGKDGTLLVSTGDAAFPAPDSDEPWLQEAVNIGIIDDSQRVNAYRSQLLNSFNGKILRIDPVTGDGLSSNPFFENTNTRSAQSRIWTYGMRNPFRFTVKPGTGSADPADGNPGTLYVGDVGWVNREELNVIEIGGLNGGWPKYEGINFINTVFQNPLYDFSNLILPVIDWRGAVAQANIRGNTYNIGDAQFTGNNFTGNSSIGGVFYTGSSFPIEYQNTYFHGDYLGWVKRFDLHIESHENEIHVEDFSSDVHPTCLAINPIDGGLYYINYFYDGASTIQEVRKIVYDPNINQLPTAIISVASPNFGSSPLVIQFDGSQSSDPENEPLTYTWDFGDGSEISNDISPIHTFTSSTNNPQYFIVTLTVTDPAGKSSSENIIVSLNNTPPTITSTSIDDIDCFSNVAPLELSLSAAVSDNEHSGDQLFYLWSIVLHHEEHSHLQTVINGLEGHAILEPIPDDNQLYYYEISFRVKDAAQLSTKMTKYIYPLKPNIVLSDPNNTMSATSNRLYFAKNSIIGTNTIQANGKSEYRAGSAIILDAGFKADLGSVFKAQVQGCNN